MYRPTTRWLIRPSIFQGLNDIDAATARRRFLVQRAEPGEILIREGEAGRALGCLVDGELEISVDGAVVGRLQPGAIMGELGLFEDSVRNATVVAPDGAELWVLGREEYEELRDTIHPICLNIEQQTIAAQVARIERIGERVAELGLGEAVSPLAQGFMAALRRLFGSGDTRPATADVAGGLGRSALFNDAPPQVLASIASRFEALACDPGAVLCLEGEVGHQMFVLGDGEVHVVVQSQDAPHRVATLRPGDAFGMVSLARAGRRMSSCVAKGSSTVFRLDHAAWTALINEPYMVGSTFRRAVIRAFAEHQRASNAQLAAWEQSPDKGPIRLD